MGVNGRGRHLYTVPSPLWTLTLCVGVLLPIGVLCVVVLHAVSFRYSCYFLPEEHSWFIPGDAF